MATRLDVFGRGESPETLREIDGSVFEASRVISRMTDSVKRLALCET